MRMQRRSLKAWGVGAVIALIAVVSFETVSLRDAQAIPAFARKYDFACNVCHVPSFPKLNDFGNLFRDHGYQLGTDQELPTWEGLTKGYWPVSFRTTVGYQLASMKAGGTQALGLATGGSNSVTTSGFGFTGLDILSFGILARDITYGVVFTPGLKSAGFGAAPSNVSPGPDLESAFVKLDNLQRFVGLGDNTYLMNLKVGKFEMDLPFSEKRSPTINTNFVMYHYQSGTPYSPVLGNVLGNLNAVSNPNNFLIGQNQPGIELAGITQTPGNGYFRYSLEGVSTNTAGDNAFVGCAGGPAVPGGAAANCANAGTDGRNILFYGHVTQSTGGYGVVSGQRVGLFGAAGSVPSTGNPVCPGCAGVGQAGQPFSRIGGDLSLTYDGQWNLFGAAMHATDSSGLFAAANPGVRVQTASWNGAFTELDYNPTWLQQGRWLFIYRYDLIRNERQGATAIAGATVPSNFNNVDSHTVMVRYNFNITHRTDTTLHLEYNSFRDKSVGLTCGGICSGADLIGNTVMAGIDFAF